MAFYTQYDHDLATKLRHLNTAVIEGWITRAEALAKARLLDPSLKGCPFCGCNPCDCTVEILVSDIEEAIRNER